MNASLALKTRQEVIEAYRAQLRAMIDGDAGALDALLDEGFTLTHPTGEEQPKAVWLAQVGGGECAYHGVEEKTVTVGIDGDTARLVGRVVADATVHGTRAERRLQLTMEYRQAGDAGDRGDTWIALRAVARDW
ncbi:nuclear transport factor 2 family protein [Streptomyces sp. NPDC006610]|jgi:hypothetical protein|uniref:nuclear transport factor 2 family protein n=1 Tax=Streptomyces sp. NPDC006610 TaxID=3154584 RepID=UPI0033B557AB